MPVPAEIASVQNAAKKFHIAPATLVVKNYARSAAQRCYGKGRNIINCFRKSIPNSFG